MHIDLIVFDMAGTTVLDGDAVSHTLRQALAGAGVRASREQMTSVMSSLPNPAAIAILLAEFRGQEAASPSAVEAVHADFRRRILWYYESHPAVSECDGASELFAWCHRHGIRTGLDTGASRDLAEAVIARMRWRDRGLIDATVCSDEVPRGRPHPDMIHRLMADTGVADPSRVMKVGDTPMDIQEGRAANCRFVVGITTGTHSAEALQAHAPTHVIAELLELPDLLATAHEGAA